MLLNQLPILSNCPSVGQFVIFPPIHVDLRQLCRLTRRKTSTVSTSRQISLPVNQQISSLLLYQQRVRLFQPCFHLFTSVFNPRLPAQLISQSVFLPSVYSLILPAPLISQSVFLPSVFNLRLPAQLISQSVFLPSVFNLRLPAQLISQSVFLPSVFNLRLPAQLISQSVFLPSVFNLRLPAPLLSQSVFLPSVLNLRLPAPLLSQSVFLPSVYNLRLPAQLISQSVFLPSVYNLRLPAQLISQSVFLPSVFNLRLPAQLISQSVFLPSVYNLRLPAQLISQSVFLPSVFNLRLPAQLISQSVFLPSVFNLRLPAQLISQSVFLPSVFNLRLPAPLLSQSVFLPSVYNLRLPAQLLSQSVFVPSVFNPRLPAQLISQSVFLPSVYNLRLPPQMISQSVFLPSVSKPASYLIHLCFLSSPAPGMSTSCLASSPLSATVLKSLTDCPQCQGVCVGATILPCGHLICRQCLHHILHPQGPPRSCRVCGKRLQVEGGEHTGDVNQLIRHLGVDPVVTCLAQRRLAAQEGVTPSGHTSANLQDLGEGGSSVTGRESATTITGQDSHVALQIFSDFVDAIPSASDAAGPDSPNQDSGHLLLDRNRNTREQENGTTEDGDPQSGGDGSGTDSDKEWQRWTKTEVKKLHQATAEQELTINKLEEILRLTQQALEKRQAQKQVIHTYSQALQQFQVCGQTEEARTFVVRAKNGGTEMVVRMESLGKHLCEVRKSGAIEETTESLVARLMHTNTLTAGLWFLVVWFAFSLSSSVSVSPFLPSVCFSFACSLLLGLCLSVSLCSFLYICLLCQRCVCICVYVCVCVCVCV